MVVCDATRKQFDWIHAAPYSPGPILDANLAETVLCLSSGHGRLPHANLAEAVDSVSSHFSLQPSQPFLQSMQPSYA